MVDSQAVTDSDYYGFNLTPPANQWTFYQEPFSAMVTAGWGTQTGLPAHPAGTDITGVQLAVEGYGFSYNIEWDQIAFYTATGIATPTFTPTPTSTPTGTWYTSTPTVTLTPIVTLTPTATPSSLLVAYPNPWPSVSSPGSTISFSYQNKQNQDKVSLKIFSLAFRKVYEDDSLPTSQGPQTKVVNVSNLNLANGLYYFSLVTKSGGQQSQKVMKVLIRQ